MDHSLLQPEIQFLTLLTFAAAIAVAVKYVRLPYTIALVIGGLFVGLTGIEPYRLTQDLILFIFLPPLLFEGAIHFELTDLRRNLRTIGTLAFPGLIVTAFLAGFLIQRVTELPMTVAILVGVMVTPTDPISVLALFKRLGVSKRLSMIVEGESVFNDGTGIVLYGVLLGIVTSGTFSLQSSLYLFLKVVIGGLLVGVLSGYLAFLLLKKLDDHVLEVLITILLAFGSFIISEHSFHVSGVMAVVAAGVVVGNQGTRFAMSPTTRIALMDFWEIAAFIINSLIFLMIGTQIHVTELIETGPAILMVFAIVILARAATCYSSVGLLNLAGERIPSRWVHIINWGGIHGSIPIALALGLPDMPRRDFILSLVFGVVFLSLTVQGLTVSPLIRLLRLAGRDEEEELYERSVASAVALRRAAEDLNRRRGEGRISHAIHERLSEELDVRLGQVQERISRLEENPAVQSLWEKKTRKSLLMLEKSTLMDLAMQGVISYESAGELIRRVDEALADEKFMIEEEEERTDDQ
ncbi:MAG: Na+/H+ antiporter [bacterium]|nr:MAG: Na+/H+ antiporter [bacterium]